VAAWTLYALTYAAFGMASTAWHAWVLFLAYGAYFALSEGVEKAYVADLAPEYLRGAAFGWFHLVVACGALPASVVFGLVWSMASPGAAFGLAAGIALLAAFLVSRLGETVANAPT
jgi:MFS family permease